MKCPNCGQDYNGGRCFYCGYAPTNRTSRVLAVVVAIFVALPCAAFGACSVYVGVTSTRSPGDVMAVPMAIMAVVALAILIGIGYLVARLWKG